ncbi:unnamed protein product [Closterium sp. NIES-65]|nr:unnamed protein product [Closterium sp. NIES-65]
MRRKGKANGKESWAGGTGEVSKGGADVSEAHFFPIGRVKFLPVSSIRPPLTASSRLRIEFIAENELVSIVPNFRADALHLHAGDIGPFRPQIALQVPLWLAIALKKRAKCSIQPPPWLAADRLTEILEAERENEGFQQMPFHYIEISQLLFSAEK